MKTVITHLRFPQAHSVGLRIGGSAHPVRLVARLGGAVDFGEVAFTKLAPEQIQRHAVDRACGSRIVSMHLRPARMHGA
jgi:hypothetical protein